MPNTEGASVEARLQSEIVRLNETVKNLQSACNEMQKQLTWYASRSAENACRADRAQELVDSHKSRVSALETQVNRLLAENQKLNTEVQKRNLAVTTTKQEIVDANYEEVPF